MNSCTRCHSDRFKAAPMTMVSPVLNLVARRRRYQCANCGRIAWHHRLRKQTFASQSTGHRTAGRGATTIVAIVTALVILSGILALKGCEPRQPPPDVMRRTGTPFHT